MSLSQEKLIDARVFVGVETMPDEVIEHVAEHKQIPDGYTEALLLANDLKAKYTAHIADEVVHDAADSTNTISAGNATDEESLIELANDLKAKYNAHRVVTPTVHNSADSENVVSLADATDLISADLLLNQIKAKYNAHLANATVHNSADETNVSTALVAYPWEQVQIGTPDGNDYVVLATERETKATGNRLQGKKRVYITKDEVKPTIPLSASGFQEITKYALVDPTIESDAAVGFYKTNRNVELSGITVLIYEAGTDPDNETNIPDFVNDDFTNLFWNGINTKGVTLNYNGEQNALGLELDPMANGTATAGKGRGTKGAFGTFAKVS